MFSFLTKSDALSILQTEIAKRLIERLQLIILQPTTILELNSPLGGFTKQLARRYRKAKILKIESIFQQFPANSVDLVFSNLMFYSREELPKIFAEIKRILQPGGLLFFSMLGPDTLWEFGETLAKLHENVKNPFIDMHDVGDMLTKALFSDPVMDMEKLTFTYSKTPKMILDLKHLIEEIFKINLSDKTLKEQIIAYSETYRDATGTLPATFEIIYGHAWGCAETIKSSKETYIPLNSLKKNASPIKKSFLNS